MSLASVLLATSGPLPNNPTYASGAQTLTATTPLGTLFVDGISAASVAANSRVLVDQQIDARQNGTYTITTAGSPSVAWVLTRATDFNQAAMPVSAGTTVAVQTGTGATLNQGNTRRLLSTVNNVDPLTDSVNWIDVYLAAAGVLPNSPTYSSGAQTLTAGSNAALVVDGVTLAATGLRILVPFQADGRQNGIFTVTTVGSGAAPWVLTRATDFNQAAMPKPAGLAVFVYNGAGGTANSGSVWRLSDKVANVNPLTDTVTWDLLSGGASSDSRGIRVISSGLGIDPTYLTNGIVQLESSSRFSYTGQTLELATVTPAFGGTGQTTYTVGDILTATGATTLSKIASGTAGEYLRGTGAASAPVWSTLTLPNAATTGDILYATGSNAIGNLAAVATGSVLLSNGTTTAPVYGQVDLSTGVVTGALPIAHGGTGQTAKQAAFDALSPLGNLGGLVTWSSGHNVQQTPGSDTQVLIMDSTQTNGLRWGVQTRYCFVGYSTVVTTPYIANSNQYYYIGNSASGHVTSAPSSNIGKDYLTTVGFRIPYLPTSVVVTWVTSGVYAVAVTSDTVTIRLYYTNPALSSSAAPVQAGSATFTSGTQPNNGTFTVTSGSFAGANGFSVWTIVLDTTTGGAAAKGFSFNGDITFIV